MSTNGEYRSDKDPLKTEQILKEKTSQRQFLEEKFLGRRDSGPNETSHSRGWSLEWLLALLLAACLYHYSTSVKNNDSEDDEDDIDQEDINRVLHSAFDKTRDYNQISEADQVKHFLLSYSLDRGVTSTI